MSASTTTEIETTKTHHQPTWSASTPGGYVPVKAEYLLHGVTKVRVDALAEHLLKTAGTGQALQQQKQQPQEEQDEKALQEDSSLNNNNGNDDDQHHHEEPATTTANNDDAASVTTTTTTTHHTKIKGMWTGSERANPVAGAAKTERPTFEGESNFMNLIGVQKTKHIVKSKNDYFKVSSSVCQSAWDKVQAAKNPQQQLQVAATTTEVATEVSFEQQQPQQHQPPEPSQSEIIPNTNLPERRTRDDEEVVVEQNQNQHNQNQNKVDGTVGARNHVAEILRLRALDDEPKEARRKRLFHDKLILAPLTTVGNLPYRRICKELGADVTCGEMALSYNLNQLQKSEWSLLRRHESEDVFGLQIAASRGGDAALTSALLHDMDFSYDFLDINVCCPVGVICDKGCGCGLFDKKTRMREVVQSMYHFQTKAVTIKSLIGPDERSPVLHKYIGEYESWGADAVILHGRSYRQRYTKSSNWDYVEECAKLTRLPLIGNGDILSWEDVVERKQFCPNVAGYMIGRGALVKPWIFEEIKEQKVKDVSSHERFEMLKKFCKYGMAHWGADEKGIATTRRFLLEWISFLCRYVPVGLMERLPQRINDRPPLYQGRDDMETFLSSDNVKDWIKISEMLLGPVGDKFHFTPKHKSNSYSISDAEKKDFVPGAVGENGATVVMNSRGAVVDLVARAAMGQNNNNNNHHNNSSAHVTGDETQPNTNVVATL